ncbi:hypothetical protein D3C71_1290620 [compost metagenome]
MSDPRIHTQEGDVAIAVRKFSTHESRHRSGGRQYTDALNGLATFNLRVHTSFNDDAPQERLDGFFSLLDIGQVVRQCFLEQGFIFPALFERDPMLNELSPAAQHAFELRVSLGRWAPNPESVGFLAQIARQ